MKAYWSDTKLNGQPLAPGQMCYVQDYTDEGMGKIPVYGASVEEILEKMSRTNASAQQMIAAQRTAPPSSAPAPKPIARLSADERMQATLDLENPATAGNAVVKLFEDQTGLSVGELIAKKFGELCVEWNRVHPEFFFHPTNQKLLTQNAIMRAGAMKNVTAAHLDAAYAELMQGGYLISETTIDPPAPGFNHQPSTPSEHTDETPSTTPARPKTSATTHRSSRLGALPTSQGWKPKWTADQIIKMPQAESLKLIQSNDQEYARACEYYWPSRATARA